MEVQPQLVLLQKTLLNIEGLGRQLDPDLDLWKTAKPFLERWMNEQVGPRAFIKGMKDNFPQALEQLPELPGLLHQFLNQQTQVTPAMVEQQKIEIKKLHKELTKQRRLSWLVLLYGTVAATAAWYYF